MVEKSRQNMLEGSFYTGQAIEQVSSIGMTALY
jgi:hypothetical protein